MANQGRPDPTIADVSCPSCGHQGLSIFYEVASVPVHSCLMLATREEALAFPRGDIRLGFCPGCGFITNTEFDPQWSAYAPNYEDQQSFSPTFNQFARELAQRLIEKYQLRHKRVLEIGCGKADFLQLLCELGENQGVGIDPAVRPDRLQNQRIQLIPEYYGDHHACWVGDFVCCRHTLEHIQPVADFLRRLRSHLSPEHPIPVFFEIPDTHRILRYQAFEDIYYEHCSYFTPASLAYLFRSCGFEILDLYMAYADQYLLIEAQPVHLAAKPSKVDGLEQVIADIHSFTDAIGTKVSAMRSHLQQLHRQKKRIAIWGSGSKCVAVLTTLGIVEWVDAIVDINPHRHGQFIPGIGKQIIAPAALCATPPDVVVVMNSLYKAEIQAMLRDLGLTSEVMLLSQ